jgi:uncharacterized membrane protein YdjX (TVP38/TMEM64 family)
MNQDVANRPVEDTGAAVAVDPAAPRRGARARQIGLLILVVAVSAGVLYLTAHYRHELAQLGRAGLLGLFVVSILGNATVIIPAPSFVMACAGGTLFGPIQSGIVSGLGAGLGELTGYMAGVGGKAIVPPGKWTDRLEGFIRRNGFVTVFALAAIPNPLFDIGGMLGVLPHARVEVRPCDCHWQVAAFYPAWNGLRGLFSTLQP